MKKQKNIKFRRRIKRKTDYKARRALLEGNIPRLVVRKTNKYIITQIITSKEAQDAVICSANSKELQNYGFDSSFKNIPAAYLTGYLIGLKAKKQKIKEAILDIGYQISTKGSKIYAALKGFADSGVKINYSEEIIPSEERIKGVHLKKKVDLEKIKKAIGEKNA